MRSAPRPARTGTPRSAPWHALSAREVLEGLSAPAGGLSAGQAAGRLAEFGPNVLPVTEAAPWWAVLLRQFVSPIIVVLLLAGAVTAVQRHWVDAGAIFVVLLVNASLGFYQERKAERDVRALRSLSTPSCRALRDGQEHTVPGPDVVPGDVVLLESGERVPADLRLLEANGLQVDESMLTGESHAATKRTEPVPEAAGTADRTDMAFSGTFVTSGRGRGVVVATGQRTELGAINELVQGPSGQSPLQVLTHSLERRIGLVVLVSVVVVFLVGLLLGNEPSQMFRTAVALAVATVPESLPIVLTVAMSVGVSRMARHHAIVRTLPAVETLGSTSTIGSDKTGTLTQNRLTVERLWAADAGADLVEEEPGGVDSDLLRAVLRTGALTNEAVPRAGAADGDGGSAYVGDAVDAAMAAVAVSLGALTEEERGTPPVAHQPYEPHLRYCQTVRRDAQGRRILHVKGSPEAVLEHSVALARAGGPGPLDEDLVLAANEEMGRDGLRVIATGVRVLDDDEELLDPLPPPSGLLLLGMEGMADPPRPGVAEAIAECLRAGIQVKMITGDHPVTAMAVAERLGLPTDAAALTGAEMAGLDDHGLAARLEQTSVAARVAPQDKLRIVQVLQDRDHVVAVTGDGVNDAPALKAASIGVAMGRSGTDVAREAADLVLTDDNFVTIVHAVRQGRVTFAAIRKATFFLLSTGAAALLAVSLSVVVDQPLLFLPVQLLWINLVTNGVQDIALTLEAAEGDELARPPRPRSEGVLSRTLWFRAGITAVWMALGVLAVFGAALGTGADEVHARSLALTTFVLFSFFQVMSARAEHKSLFQLDLLGNKPLVLTSFAALALHWGVLAWPVSAGLMGLAPLDASEWLLAVLVGSSVLVVVEAEKLVRRWSRRRRAR
ncbi:HAD-IC family P-type ATPase [uncultured Kocuria sp.]|uniref:cation-translocating P-type ATPase n=1 Tax=uncultured Kocuria sp. TaxID=259305 RepID=UPI0026115141|nr:HAD-IC family P-type ATPase [uncultured Kocuria sp.]